MRQKVTLWGSVFGVLLLLAIAACTTLQPTTTDSVHLLLGNPSGATPSVATPDNYLILRPQYALSFNRSKNILNWASWQLNQRWLGNLPRPPFEPDTSLPQGWYVVRSQDYTGSGFDRGHTVPASDRSRTPADSAAVFLMTNIFPQAPDNNQGPWQELEIYCRDLVRRDGKELYIIAGSAGVGGTGDRGRRQTIGSGRISVPARTWKIVVVLDTPGSGLAGITASTRTIAVIMPNRQGIKNERWQTYRVSIDQVEQLTGYDFLSAVPESIQRAIEAKVDGS